MYAELGVHAAAIGVTVALSRGRDRIDQPVEMEPHHARVPPHERDDGEKKDIPDDEGDQDVPTGREPEPEDDEREHRDPDRVARDHRAGPVPSLALEAQSADRTGLVHREHSAPHTPGETPRATAAADRPRPAHR